MKQGLGIFEKLGDRMRSVAAMENLFWESAIPTGILGLDERIGGFRPGELIVLASEQPWLHMSLMQLFIESVAIKQQRPVAVIRNGQNLRDYCRSCFLSNDAVPWSWGMQPVSGGEPDWSKLQDIVDAPIYITQPPHSIGIDYLLKEADKLSGAVGQLGLVVIDGIDYINVWSQCDAGAGNPASSWAMISSALKQMATHLKCPIVVDTRIINRQPESGYLTHPGLRDLPYEGALSNSADLVLLLQDFSYLQNGMRARLETRFSRNGLLASAEFDYQSENNAWIELRH